MSLTGKSVFLRAVEKEDATKLMLWENNPKHWKITGTEVPFSFSSILEYIDQAQHIRTHGQLRMMICMNGTREPIGAIDLYQVDFKHLRAAVGILIADEDNKNHGYAFEALTILEKYATQILALHNLHCSIHSDNLASVGLFEKAGFVRVGVRKEWYLEKGAWLDEILYQKCLERKETKS